MTNHPSRSRRNLPAALNLVQSWLTVATCGGRPITHALAELNEELGSGHSLRRLGEWRRGDRPIPQAVQDYMLRCSVLHAMRSEGAIPPDTDDALDRIAERLCPPALRNR